jgi:RNA polymerase sigma-70 factor (ECF subfamily)
MEFWELYDRHYEGVRRFIPASVKDQWVAEDLVQETFIRVQANLNGLRDPAKLSSWIFSIAHNQCRDHFRKVKRSFVFDNEYEEGTQISEAPSVQERMEQREMNACVHNLTDLLPESLRSVIILFDMMEFSHREVAAVVGITEENAKVRLHRARKRMRSLLEEHCDFETDGRSVLVCEPRTREAGCGCREDARPSNRTENPLQETFHVSLRIPERDSSTRV